MDKELLKKASGLQPEEVAGLVKSSLEKGLSDQEAQERLASIGANQVPERQVLWWQTLWDQFQSPFIYLLLIICGLMVILGETTNALITLAIVALNTLVGFYQEYKAAQAIEALKHLMVLQSTVIRQGVQKEIKTSELVPGDLIVLYPGDIISADGRIVWQDQLVIDESSLTGESIPIAKTSAIQDPSHTNRSSNLVFSGTTVISGKARVLVIVTGMNTSLGEIARLVTEEIPPSAFAQGITTISKFMVYLTVGTILLLVGVHYIVAQGHLAFFELIMFAAALGVSVIPEALPVVITFCLTRGATLLAQHQVVVKRLSAIEDLGSMQVLCTDKTGTLTENKMSVAAVYGPEKEVLFYGTLGAGIAAGNLAIAKGFDAALFKALATNEQQRLDAYHKKGEIPFDPERRRSMVVCEGPEGIEIIVRGAFENVVALSEQVIVDNSKVKAWIFEQGALGRRVLAIATGKSDHIPESLEQLEKKITQIGLIAFEDPLKSTAREAVEKAKHLGLHIKVLSGDSAEVCAAVGIAVDIINSPDQVMLGKEFETLSYDDKRSAIDQHAVFARTTPSQKYEIIKILQERYQVGYLGDGINDAPALRIANVAIVVDDATDIARQSADIILLHRSLRIIVDGISYGRQTFVNTMKFLKTTLAGNVGNFYAIGMASLFIEHLPMLPTQLLLLNFLSDIPLIALSTDKVDEEDIAVPQRYDIRDIALITLILGITSTLFDFLVFAWFFRAAPAVLQTNWFIASIWTELGFMLSIRTRGFMLTSTRPSTMIMILAAIVGGISLFLPYSSWGQYYFHFVAPQSYDLLVIGIIVVLYVIATEIVKFIYYRFQKGN